jgi:hypothetical protein
MNDEMVMERRGGTKSKIVGRMLNVFNLHFHTPAVEAMSRIYACKTERNLQIFGCGLQFKQSCPWATLSYFCLQKQSREINAMRRVISENVFKRAQLSLYILHFPTPAVEAMSRIYARKTERNLQIFGWCLQFKQSCPWATLSYFCLQKQSREINAMRRVVSENVFKRAQRYHSHGMRRSLFAN